MPLSPGSHLGPYEILALIGAGGMGEVYRARDPRLGREVAIKVLPHDRIADEHRRQRFVQEAKAASALNHPHIVTIHEIESADGIDFLVMEYVRGKSLEALIPRQGMRLGEALRIAIAVADAVACAHKHNIVHRDLKPANVMVGTDGAVKVLDFGLAKLLTDDGDSDPHAPTRTADEAITKRGAVMGTLAYMSPEQASGEAVDARSDVFSFGAMLYEMVNGERAFAGKTPTDTLAAVLRAQPKPPSAIVSGVPGDLEKVIFRCLRKEPARRFQHMDDVKVALDEVKEESESGAPVPASPPRSPRRLLTAALVGSVILIACVGVWLFRRPPSVQSPSPRVAQLTTLTGSEAWPTFSPDGEQIAFSWDGEKQNNPDIYVKIIGSAEVRRLTTDAAPDVAPSWSPDGKVIAFIREQPEGNLIHLVSALGGIDRRLSGVSVATFRSQLGWSPDGRYIAAARYDPAHPASDRAIYLIPAEGGEPRTLVSGGINYAPAFSPDGHGVAYISCVDLKLPNNCEVNLLELDAAYVATGPPRQLTPKPFLSSGGLTWSRDGRSVIFAAAEVGLSYLWRVAIDSDQAPERLEIAGMKALWPATSRARDRLAFGRGVSVRGIYRFQIGRPPELVLSSSFGAEDASPDYSPDGQRIAFASNRSGDAFDIWVAAAGGSAAHQLTHGPNRWQGSPHWSPDGRTLAFDSLGVDEHWHIWTIDADGASPRQVTRGAGDQNIPTWSHDGQWIYFAWDQDGGRDVWRTHLTSGTNQRLTHGSAGPTGHESADGKNLVYQPKLRDSPLLMVSLTGGVPHQIADCVTGTAVFVGLAGTYYVACQTGADLPVHLITPTGEGRLFGTLEGFESGLPTDFAVSPDGKSILYVRKITKGADLMLIENFR